MDGVTYYKDLINTQSYGNSDYYTYHYNNEDQVSEVLFNNHLQYTYEYDALGRLSVFNDLYNDKSFINQYDLTGRVREITDEGGNYINIITTIKEILRKNVEFS